MLDSIQGMLAALARIEGMPPRVIAGHVQERQQCRQAGNKSRVQSLQRLCQPEAERLAVGGLGEVQAGAEEVAYRQIGDETAVRHATPLQYQHLLCRRRGTRRVS